MFNNRKAQIGETVTWVVATIAIIIILVISVLVVSIGPFKNREFKEGGTSDLLVTKSFTGYLLTDDGNGVVFEQLKDKKTYLEAPQETTRIDRTFPKKIFLGLYKDEYSSNQIFLRINSEWCGWDGSSKCDNRKVLFNQGGLPSNMKATKLFYDRIKLKDWGDETKNTILELMLN